MAYNDIIFVQSSGSQGDAVTLYTYKTSGEVFRNNVVNYSGYANTHSGRWQPIPGY